MDVGFYGVVTCGCGALWGSAPWLWGSMGRCPLAVGLYGAMPPGCGALWGGPTRRSPHFPPPQEVKLLDLFASEDAAVPYTFYKTFGGTTHTFEAAAFPGHFLSTAQQSDRELGLAPRAAPGSITSFYLRRQ